LALPHNARQTTKDVDVYIVAPEKAAILRAAASRVAERLELPGEWLNDGAHPQPLDRRGRSIASLVDTMGVIIYAYVAMVVMRDVIAEHRVQ
jgi:hypothetical protein